MHIKLIRRKIYKKYELKDHIDRLSSDLRTYYDIRYRMDNFNKVNKKLIEFTNLIYEDNRNMSVKERYREKLYTLMKNKPKNKKRKIVYNKSKILELEIKKGIDELTFLNENLDLLKKSDKKLKIYKKRKKKYA